MEANCVSHGIDVVSALGDLPPTHDNLVYRSLERLRQAAGVTAGANVGLHKRIPAAAGLGGASSDAAAALLAANRLWELGWSRSRLMQWAAQLGSDIPFFLSECGLARARGRGEQVEAVPVGGVLHCVVVRPPLGLSTADVYRGCRPAHQPADSGALRQDLQDGRLTGLRRGLFNRLEAAALQISPGLQALRDQLERLELVGSGMSGSGSSFFGICRNRRQAQRAAALLRAARMGLVLTATTRPSRCRFGGSTERSASWKSPKCASS
jgi:4-diphosphocytidyl-2-C-methyl-D-erythritol kinase